MNPSSVNKSSATESSGAGWTVYTADMRSHTGIVEAWTQIGRDIFDSRFLIWQLFVKDFKAQYQQSLLGILWTVIMPLIPVTIYLFMRLIGVLMPGTTGVPYVLFVIAGLTIWKIFADGVNFSIGKLLEARCVLTKIRVPKIAIICSGMGRVFFEALIRGSLVGLTMIWCELWPSPQGMVLVILALFPLMCLTLAIGMLASLVNIVVRDVQKLVELGMTYAMFVSSVIFVMPEHGVIGTVNALNPMNTFVMGIREILVFGAPSRPVLFLLTSVASVLILLLLGRVFYVMEHVIDDKL